MKSLGFFLTIMLLTLMGYVQAYAGGSKKGPGPNGNENDTITNFKSNIVIFKMIPGPAAGNPTNTNGSLKKAGKVARTSNSPHTTIEHILYKKKGI